MGDRLDLLITGVMPAIAIASAGLTLLISWLLLRIYRQAVIRTMGNPAGDRANAARHKNSGNTGNASADASANADSTQLSQAWLGDRLPGEQAARLKAQLKAQLKARLRVGPWQQAAAYGAGGLCYAAVMALALQLSFGDDFLPLRFLCLLWLYLWPAAILANLAAASTRRVLARSLGLYFAGLLALGLLAQALSGSGFSWSDLLVLWLTFNLPATLLLLACLHPKIRAVGPLVLTATLFVVAGFLAILFFISSQPLLLEGVVRLSLALGQNNVFVFLGIALLSSLLLFGSLGWVALQWIRRSYEQKRIGDQFLGAIAIALFFALAHSINLASMSGGGWVLGGLPAFLAFFWVARACLKKAAAPAAGRDEFRESRPTGSVNLLLLRVFALGPRSEQLFQSLALHWRHIGSLQMIAGPDLVNAAVEPHEFLEFVTGKLARRFIDGDRTLARRLAERDLRPDFDGRFRVNDFFCYDDTWKLALTSLLATSEVVLMDLRSFSRQRAGCIFEINALIHTVPVEKFVLLVDATTDERFLRETILSVWNARPARSPNAHQPADAVQIFRWARGARSLSALFQTLLTGVESGSVAAEHLGR